MCIKCKTPTSIPHKCYPQVWEIEHSERTHIGPSNGRLLQNFRLASIKCYVVDHDGAALHHVELDTVCQHSYGLCASNTGGTTWYILRCNAEKAVFMPCQHVVTFTHEGKLEAIKCSVVRVTRGPTHAWNCMQHTWSTTLTWQKLDTTVWFCCLCCLGLHLETTNVVDTSKTNINHLCNPCPRLHPNAGQHKP